MRNIPNLILLLFSLSIFLGCKGKSNSTATSTPSLAPATTQPAPAHPLPSITLTEMQKLYDKCDYIDLIFYNMDFSMSVNDKSNVQRVVAFVDKAQPRADLTCPTMGRIIFQHDGEVLIEADMHYSKDCQHFIFYNKDNKKVYANRITQQGITYFQQMFSQVKVAPK